MVSVEAPVLIDELIIPQSAGTIRVILSPRMTVFAGLDRHRRQKMSELLVGALAGRGPAWAWTRDDLGHHALVGPPSPDVHAVSGRDPIRRGPVASAALDWMVVGPRELGLGPGRRAPSPPQRTALAIDHRRLVVELSAIEAGVFERRRLSEELAARDRHKIQVPAVAGAARRPAGRFDGSPLVDAATEIDALPGAIRESAGEPWQDDGARRVVARRQVMIGGRIAELPTDEDLASARLQLEQATAAVEQLDAGDAPAERDLAPVRNALLGRISALRPTGTAAEVPLVLDEAFSPLAPPARCELLDVAARLSTQVQVVVLTGDAVVVEWARCHHGRGPLRLVELAE